MLFGASMMIDCVTWKVAVATTRYRFLYWVDGVLGVSLRTRSPFVP